MRTSPSGSAVTLGFRFPLCLDGFFQRVEFDHPRAARLLFLPVRPFQPQALTPYRAQGHRKVDEAVKILLTANSGEERLAMKSGFFESAPVGS